MFHTHTDHNAEYIAMQFQHDWHPRNKVPAFCQLKLFNMLKCLV